MQIKFYAHFVLKTSELLILTLFVHLKSVEIPFSLTTTNKSWHPGCGEKSRGNCGERKGRDELSKERCYALLTSTISRGVNINSNPRIALASKITT